MPLLYRGHKPASATFVIYVDLNYLYKYYEFEKKNHASTFWIVHNNLSGYIVYMQSHVLCTLSVKDKIYYSFFFGVTKKTNLSTVEINIWPSLKSKILIFLCTFSLFEVFIYSSTHRDQYPRFAFQSVPKRTFDRSPLYVPSGNFEGFDIKGVGLVTKFCLTTVIKF